MNPPSGPRQQQQPQKQNTLTMQKHENTLEFHSRLFFFKLPHNRHPERSASQMDR
jgi:hypothetical protein